MHKSGQKLICESTVLYTVIVAKSVILDPSNFLGKIRKIEARLGKLTKIRKNETH